MRSWLLPAVVILALSAAAQQAPTQKPSEKQPSPPEASQPQQPGAAVQPIQPPSPDELPAEAEAQPEYQGPAILSRGGEASVGRGGELMRLQPYLSLEGVYDTGLGTTSLTPAGEIPYADGYGAQLRYGVTGSHAWKRTLLGLDYRGAFRHYSRETYYDGVDNSLALSLQHRASRRVTISLSEAAARYERAFFLPFAMQLYDPALSGLTGSDLFDTPTYLLSSGAQLTYQRTARLSFGMSGSGFVVRRRSEALVGANGYSATGDIAYRLSRSQTIGVQYDFNHYDYQRQFGSADIQGAGLNYSARLGRRWEIALRGGGFRVEALRLQSVRLDPAIAAILGRNVGVETYHRVIYVPRFDVRLARGFRHSLFTATYRKTVLPGNGVYLTSATEGASLGYSYSGIRRTSLHLTMAYNTYSSLAQTIGKYRGYTGGGGVSYKLTRGIALIASAYGRSARIATPGWDREFYRVSAGFAWAPGDYPVSLW